MLAAATLWLERHVEAINAINVYPVPDGDTGTNMYLTLRAATAAQPYDARADTAIRAMAHGALLGARGNGGVILSQFLRGMADALDGTPAFDSAGFARALATGADSAYRAVSTPVEGTILTVAREVGAATIKAASGDGDIVSVLATAVDVGRVALEHTPALLPALAEAGVVDAGGMGFVTILDGALRHLRGEDIASAPMEPAPAPAVLPAHLREAHTGFGYCTEFLIMGATISMGQLREQLNKLGDSVLVVGEEDVIRAHVHTENPGQALSIATATGRLHSVKIDDMAAQHIAAFGGEGSVARAADAISVAAVCAGRGLGDVFRATGAAAIVPGGQSMNPSAREILEGVKAAGTAQVIVLPNNKNVIMAAEQAASLAEGTTVYIAPTRTIPQGLAALLAFNPERSAAENIAAMENAATMIRTVDVTRAVRDASMEGVTVRKGEAIAMIDGDLALGAGTIEDAVVLALERVNCAEAALVTLYPGGGTSDADADALAGRVRTAYPGVEVEVVRGGQPHYHYIVSVE